ncbi:MAG: putative F420-dependent oxidoreductase [Gammaproteobacteria bacterium]|jgi:probable F420-dependent oxidoreductase
MEFGLHVGTRGAAGTPDGLRSIAIKAQSLGFSHIGLSDHVVIATDVESWYPYTDNGKWFAQDSGYCLEQISLLNFLAGCTETIRLLSSVMVVPYRHPILTAKMLVTADVMSKGRLIVGVGSGWMAEEMRLLDSPPFADRGQITNEYIQAFRNLWTESAPEFHGKFVDYAHLKFEPKPLQKPHPPIWVGGESRPARRRAAQLGDAWYPVSNNPAALLDTAQRFASAFDSVQHMAAAAGRDPANIDSALLAIGYRLEADASNSPERRTFTGSAQAIIDDIGGYRDHALKHMIISFESDDLNKSIDTLEAFASDIMPALK